MNPKQKTLQIKPISNPLKSSIRVPGSKSITNRSLLISALVDGITTINNALFSDDCLYFANALQTLGFNITLSPEEARITVAGQGGKIPAQKADLFIGNAGTAARFLTAFLTLGSGEFILDGDARMRERPIEDLINALTGLGAKIEATNNQQSPLCPPVKINAAGLSGGKTKIAGDTSSQFLSALLMVAPYAKAPVEINLTTELFSKPYVELTLSVMSDFGVEVDRFGYNRFIIRPARYNPRDSYLIESDASAASYFFAASAICGGSVRIENISRSSKQGDIRFLDVLEKTGCVITHHENSIKVTGPSELMGLDLDLGDMPDTAQTLAVVAPFATSPTRIRGIASARLKETDRIAATCNELNRIGVQVVEHDDGMTIYPCNEFHPGTIQTYNDHRMAMAFSLIGLRVPGIVIENPGCVSKTFPNFYSVLESLL